jgi:5-methylcytosine-specific restriction protein A
MPKKQRSNEMLLVGYYLARCGDGTHPPRALNVKDWNRAYAMFYGELGEGRVLSVFKNSLKNVRDAFDAHVESPRVGWKPGEPARQRAKEILEKYGHVSDEKLAHMVKPYVDMEVANVSKETLAVAYAELSPAESMIEAKTEGGQKVYISVAREKRNLSLRDPAIQFHGTSCVVCGFDFGEVYGEWGKGFIEVHHLVPMSSMAKERMTDPKTDLTVVCANCHRMIHRKRDVALRIDELRAKIENA